MNNYSFEQEFIALDGVDKYTFWKLFKNGRFLSEPAKVGYIRQYSDNTDTYWIYTQTKQDWWGACISFKTLKEAKDYLMALYVLKGIIEP
jgi:hypothetical protein